MRRKRQIRGAQAAEEEHLNAVMEGFASRAPTMRIYRLEGKKQTYLGTSDLDDFSLEDVRERFGAGEFLLRSVRANGTYGPSRVVSIAPILRDYQRR